MNKINLELYEKYFENLVVWNEKFNLTSVIEREEVLSKHFFDSIQGAEFLRDGDMVCDVGSGAGFPGIPLKIERPGICLTLMDSIGKKVNFLQHLINELQLSKTIVIKTRAEDAARKKHRESFDVVTARAIARLNVLLEYCLPLVKVGGIFLAYKTRDDNEISESNNALRILGGRILKIKDYLLKTGEERRIIVIEKTKRCPNEYPRGLGKERKNPL